MRIVSGKLKRLRFQPPKGFPSRPTTDFAKEGLFNVLENQYDIDQLEVLDLFAGTGNISFEFASRDAVKVVAVDRNFKCANFIQSFAEKHELDNLLTQKSDVFKFIEQHAGSYDLIFADPPFKVDFYDELISSVLESNLLSENGIFILEHEKRRSFEEHPNFDVARKYGNVVFSFFSKK
tara:strand:- start:27151 stop:27687 length:537 start_codon:yes stop_codon:yes gene_type:complete